MIPTPIYEDCFLDHTEDVENYRAGGYHPVSIGHIIKEGRYKILHKLGYGAFATVWLARDLSHEIQKSTLGSLVCLKISVATPAEQSVETYGEVQIPRVLVTTGRCKEFLCAHILPAAEPFIEHGPNGFCLCVVLAVAGPSLLEVCHRISGRVLGSRRLRSDLARTIASQVAHFVHGMHDAGCVHGDLRSANLLFKITGKLQEWSNEDVYINLGQPNTSEVERLDGQPTGHCAPTEVVQPIHTTKFMEAGLVDWENIVVVDFGQSFITHERPPTYMPATAVHYQAPETLFDQEFTAATDVWSLGCLLFEIRAGFPLFDPIMYANETSILIQNVNMLGKLPEPWWTAFTDCVEYFEENGDPKDPKHRTSIHDKLRRIGTQDTIPRRKDQEDGPMFEIRGTRLAEEEVELLGDLLGRMVTYRPEERMPMEDVIRHPWFSFQSADVLK